MSGIPRLIHQTWKTSEVPEEWKTAVASWKHFHPDWEYRLWSNEDGFRFVERYYPEFYPHYCELDYDIQRADAIRYLVVYHYGGLYVDMDYECLRPFDKLLKDRRFVMGYEPPEHFHERDDPDVLCNALFAAAPGSAFLLQAVEEIGKQVREGNSENGVLESTGPLMLQRVFKAYSGEELSIFPSRTFAPLAYYSTALHKLKTNHDASDEIRRILLQQGVYAVHYWANTWVKDL